ncbi:MAG: FAD-dependent oxidoreductase [Cyanobacteria bacterium QS_5_48_63]|nr:MAG: FAD-dependent oxidoreductase [Cyanobacteria bacterium QS_5_48_63]
MTKTERILSQLPGDVLGGLRKADQIWQALLKGDTSVPLVVKESQTPLEGLDYDLVISGGTLGILIGAALQQRGWQVAVIERGILQGREQEWNISRQELEVFIELGVLSEVELEQAIATEFNPSRVGFHQGLEVWVKDILNIGVDPVILLDTIKSKFLDAGGQLLEKMPFSSAVVHPDGVDVEAGNTRLKTRLLIDAMGHFSPIAKQARGGQKPEGACVVVGGCAQGYPQNETGDLLLSFTPIQNQCQYFWEAFPAKDGRTTYLFTYLDTHPQRPSLEFFVEEYLRLLPQYQNVELSQLDFQRMLFGFFPSYRKSPLHMPWSRILPIGDSSGIQSPVSFGGFGAMIRHLKRLTLGIDEALQTDCLSRNDLTLLQPYQPNIAATWLFQRAMSVGIEQQLPPNQINHLLSGVFDSMDKLGDDVLRPFLQDVVQFRALTQTLALTTLTKPGLVASVIPQVGLQSLLDWMVHYINLGIYSGLYPLGKLATPMVKNFPPTQQYTYHRWIDAWKYGSGRDYDE